MQDFDKAIFPGYEQARKKQEQKANERKKHAEEKRKNSLPPFLMVRGGLFDEAVMVALIMIPLAEFTVGKYREQNGIAAFLCTCMYAVPFIFLAVKWVIMSHEKNVIKKDLDFYTWGSERELPPIAKYECPRMAKIMTRYASKNNPEFFDTLIKNPSSVQDEKTASAIIRGHIKSHPEDIQTVLDTFNANTIPKKLYRQLKRKQR